MSVPRLVDIVRSLLGAWRLARFDAQGFAFFEETNVEIWQSFFAAVLVAPINILRLAIEYGQLPTPHDPLRYAVVESTAYVISWIAYPVVMEWLTRQMGCRARFPRYIVAYNWCLVIQYGLWLPLLIMADSGIIAEFVTDHALFFAFAYVLLYAWFLARHGLAISALAAVALVIGDLLMGILIGSVAASIS